MAEAKFPALNAKLLPDIDVDALRAPSDQGHAPRILLLYGSLRPESYSRKTAEESARILEQLGCETRLYNPSGLPLVDDETADHSKVDDDTIDCRTTTQGPGHAAESEDTPRRAPACRGFIAPRTWRRTGA